MAVVSLTDDTGRQIFLSKTSSLISFYVVAAAFITLAKIKNFISLLKLLSSRSEWKGITGLSVWNFVENSLRIIAV